MIAPDTHVLLRCALNDDPALSPPALELISGNDCHVGLLALVEAGFVLASVYRAIVAEIAALKPAPLAIPTLHFERKERLPAALEDGEVGIDWFDAMLWAGSRDHALDTFDHDFARHAAHLAWQPPAESTLPPRMRQGA